MKKFLILCDPCEIGDYRGCNSYDSYEDARGEIRNYPNGKIYLVEIKKYHLFTSKPEEIVSFEETEIGAALELVEKVK